MCATVCPSQALAYLPREELERRREQPTNTFYFGKQKITTQVYMMVPPHEAAVAIDVVDYMWEGEQAYETLSAP